MKHEQLEDAIKTYRFFLCGRYGPTQSAVPKTNASFRFWGKGIPRESIERRGEDRSIEERFIAALGIAVQDRAWSRNLALNQAGCSARQQMQ